MPPCNFELEVVEFLMSNSTEELFSQVSGVSSTLGTYAAGIAASGCALYGVLWAVAYASGSQNGDVIGFMKWLTKAMFFIALAGTGSFYNHFVAETFWNLPAEVGQHVSQGGMSNGLELDASGKLSFGTSLDVAAQRGVCTATALWKETSTWKPVESVGYFLAGLVVILGVVIFVALAAGLAFMGYASLAIVLALGPLFIIAGIWDATRPMFESFIRTALNYALYGIVLMVIVGIAIGLVDSFAESGMGQVNGAADLYIVLSIAVRALFVFAIASALLLKADDISASLVGGISMGAAGLLARTGSVAGAGVKGAMGAGKTAMNPSKAWGEFKGGQFHTDPRNGKVAYKSAGDVRDGYKSALSHARKNNTIRKQ